MPESHSDRRLERDRPPGRPKSPVASSVGRLVGCGMKMFWMAARAVLLAVVSMSVTSGFSQSKSVAFSQAEIANAQVRRLIGMDVENRDGSKLGVIKDFV